MRPVRVLTTACALAGAIGLVAPTVAGAALKRVSTQSEFPIAVGNTLVWEAEGQGTTDNTGAYVWSVPASGSSPAKVVFQAPPVPGEGVVGTDSSKTTPGSQPDGIEATSSFIYFQYQTGVFKTQQAGKGSPNYYTDFFATAPNNLVAGALTGPLAPMTLSADPGDPCPAGTITEVPIAATGSSLITNASCSTSATTAPSRLLARTITNGQSTTPPLFLAGNGQSIGEAAAAGNYLAGVQQMSGSDRNRIVVIDITSGDVVNTTPYSPANSFYLGVDVGTDGSVVATLQKYVKKQLSVSVVRFAAGSSQGTTFPSSVGSVTGTPQIVGSRVVMLRSASGGDIQLISTSTTGTSVKGLGTFDSTFGDLTASSTYAAVAGIVDNKKGIYATAV